MEYSLDADIRLIEAVGRREILWNREHPDRENSRLIGKIWDDVAVELNLNSKCICV